MRSGLTRSAARKRGKRVERLVERAASALTDQGKVTAGLAARHADRNARWAAGRLGRIEAVPVSASASERTYALPLVLA